MIALYSGISLLSRAIRWRTWSCYSHCAWLDGDGSVFEAWHPHGVRHVANVNIGHTPGTVIDVFDVELTDDQKDGLRAWLTSQLGKPYDLNAILGFIWRRKLEDDSAWVCSELIYQGFREVGIDLLASDVPAWKVSPGVLAMGPFLTKTGTLVTR